MACGCGSKARSAATASATSADTSESAMRFEVRDNKGQVEQFASRSDAQVFLGRHGGVLRPI